MRNDRLYDDDPRNPDDFTRFDAVLGLVILGVVTAVITAADRGGTFKASY